MNKNIILSGGEKDLTGGGKWGGGEGSGGEGEGSGGKGGGKWGMGTPPLSTPSINDAHCINQLETANKQRI